MQTFRHNITTDETSTLDEQFDTMDELLTAIQRNVEDPEVESFTVTMNRHERRRAEKLARQTPKPRRKKRR